MIAKEYLKSHSRERRKKSEKDLRNENKKRVCRPTLRNEIIPFFLQKERMKTESHAVPLVRIHCRLEVLRRPLDIWISRIKNRVTIILFPIGIGASEEEAEPCEGAVAQCLLVRGHGPQRLLVLVNRLHTRDEAVR
jgi:hypothetical protein